MSIEPYWDRPTVERLLRAYSDGGRPGALAAFPDLRPAQVYCAIRRYADSPTGEPPPADAAERDPRPHRRNAAGGVP